MLMHDSPTTEVSILPWECLSVLNSSDIDPSVGKIDVNRVLPPLKGRLFGLSRVRIGWEVDLWFGCHSNPLAKLLNETVITIVTRRRLKLYLGSIMITFECDCWSSVVVAIVEVEKQTMNDERENAAEHFFENCERYSADSLEPKWQTSTSQTRQCHKFVPAASQINQHPSQTTEDIS